MGLPAELHEYAVDLAFNGADPHGGFRRFEQFAADCADEADHIVMLQILAYAKGPADPPVVLDFLEKCLKSELEDVRKNASFFTAPRFLKAGRTARERLLSILKKVSREDPSESVRKSAAAGLFVAGEISEDTFRRSQAGLTDQDP